MSLNLNPYPEYKDSGLPWLGEIPVHWNLLRAKYVFREIDERSATGQETHLSMSQKYGLVESSRIEDWRLQSESYVGGKLCETDDLVLNRLKAHLGVFAHAPISGVVSPDYTVLRRVRNNELRFFEYLFKTPGFNGELRKSTKGIVEGFWRLYTDDLYRIRVPVPPDSEQRRIVSWLDKFGCLVTQLIDGKQRLIELLNQQKQAIIQQGVTQGVDPKVPMRGANFDWLPEVPEHWEIVKLRRIVRLNPSKSEVAPDRATSENVVFLPMEKVSEDGYIDCTERRTLAEVWEGFTYFRKHDVIVAKITPCFENGKGAHLGSLESEFGFGSTEFTVLRAGSRVLPEFIYRVTASTWFRRLGEESMTGAAGQKRIPNDFIKNFDVALPPLEEQEQILGFLGKEERTLNTAIQRAQREIEFIREYRTRLISDVVTGKLDVRDVELPDVEGESEELPSIELEDDDTGELLTAEGVGDVNL